MVKRISRKRSKKYNKRNNKTKRKMNRRNTRRNYTKRNNTKYKNTKYKNTKLRNNKRRNMRGGSYEERLRQAIEESLKDMETAGGSGENTGWQCSTCTLLNTARLSQCAVCDTPRVAIEPVSRDRVKGVSPPERPSNSRITVRPRRKKPSNKIFRNKLEAAQVRLAFAKLLISESGLIDNIDIIIKIGDLLTDKLLVVLPDNHPRIKWDEWKALYAPDEVREPEFNVEGTTFTLDNLNIGDRYSVDLGNLPGAQVNYRGVFEITDFNYKLTDERFMCEVILSGIPNKIQFIYNNPLSRIGEKDEEGVGWMTRWRSSVWTGVVINCSRL